MCDFGKSFETLTQRLPPSVFVSASHDVNSLTTFFFQLLSCRHDFSGHSHDISQPSLMQRTTSTETCICFAREQAASDLVMLV